MVVITPFAATMRMRLSPESLITKPPAGITSMPFGALSCAAVAAPPSPQAAVAELHVAPVPATRVMVPLAETMRTFWP